jgi:hypothetical protein
MGYLLPKLKKIENNAEYLKEHCADAAQAIKDTHGGELYILGDFPSQRFWHVLVRIKGRYWDVSGPKTKKYINQKYPKMDLKKATKKDVNELQKIQNKQRIKELKRIIE